MGAALDPAARRRSPGGAARATIGQRRLAERPRAALAASTAVVSAPAGRSAGASWAIGSRSGAHRVS